MKILMKLTVLIAFLLASASVAAEGEGTQRIGVLGGDFSDAALSVQRGESCADMLKYLFSPSEKYTIVNVAGVTGPPGVIYLMQNPKGEVAVLKCGTACGHEGGEEH